MSDASSLGRLRRVAAGVWLYDKVVPHRIEIFAGPAEFAASRFDDDENLDDTVPVPKTQDGRVYYVGDRRPEFHSLEEAKAWADTQPWGPVEWDPDPDA